MNVSSGRLSVPARRLPTKPIALAFEGKGAMIKSIKAAA